MTFRSFDLLACLTLVSLCIGCPDSTPTATAPPGVRDISHEEFLESPPIGAVILDVRTSEEYERGHVPNAVHIPYDQLADRMDELGDAMETPIVVYCESGKRASMAGDTLLAAGWTNVLHLDGDMREWREKNRPTAR